MRAKRFLAIIGFILTLLGNLALLPSVAFAQETAPSEGGSSNAQNVPDAANPSLCASKVITVDGKQKYAQPSNCLFLEEPIGGKPGYDLYVVTCGVILGGVPQCEYSPWSGGQLTPGARGPIQAVLTRTPGKEFQGPFGLLYGYLGLIYNYVSGIIIGFSVLMVVAGGIQISMAGGDETKYKAGVDRIKKAVLGVIIWFMASLILYTINPTFFTF